MHCNSNRYLVTQLGIRRRTVVIPFRHATRPSSLSSKTAARLVFAFWYGRNLLGSATFRPLGKLRRCPKRTTYEEIWRGKVNQADALLRLCICTAVV